MKVFVDTMFGSTFSFDLDPRNNVFHIKKSIETSQGIPVSMQTLYFNNAELVVDHYQLIVYRIVNNSRLLLLLRADLVNNQILPQSPYAIQGYVPSMARSNYNQVPPSHARQSFFNQDLSMMPRSSQVPPQVVSNHQNEFLGRVPEMPLTTFGDNSKIQDQSLGRSNYDQVPLSHASESFFNQYPLVNNDGLFPEMPQDISFLPPGTTFGDNVKIQDNDKNQDLPPLPSSTFEDLWLGEDFANMFQTDRSITFGDFSFGDYGHILTDDNVQSNWRATTSDEIIMNNNPVVQTEDSPAQSNSTEESSNQVFQTEKSPPPQKLTLTMTQYDKPGSKYLVDVIATDNVEELKKELEYKLDLPAKRYFLLHKERVLDDDKSFSMNRVADGDTIEIFPGPDIEDYHT